MSGGKLTPNEYREKGRAYPKYIYLIIILIRKE